MFKFEDNDNKVFCIKDSNVELSAVFEVLPKDLDTITIEWTRDGKPITNSEKFKVTKTNNAIQLAIQHVQRDDAGHYKLYAKTETGETAEKDIELLVEDRSFGDNPPAFIRRLNDLAVKVGTRTRLLVEIRSATDVRVTWYRNDRRICENDRVNFVNEGSFYCLEISSITLDDGGKWMCMAENLGGRNSCLATLNVLVPKAYKAPEFVEELRAILTEQGTVSLECKVVGVPTPLLRWFKDSKEIKAGDVFALTANPDDLTSLGTYTCEAVNCMGKTYSSSKLHISGKTSRESSLQPPGKSQGPPPIFTSELKNIRSKIGDSITLGCQVMVPPWPKVVTWYNKDGKIESSEKYKLIEDGLGSYILEIKPAEFTDEGEWKFVVTSAEGTVSISTCFVHMDIPKNYRKPRFMESLKAILTDEGLVSFECKVVGFPTPLLRWFKDGHELKPGDVYQLTGTNSLGSYSCIARNCMGEASSSAVLTLEDIQNQLNENERIELQQKNQPPKFIKGLMSTETRINEEYKFQVQIKATTEPVFSWYRDDLPIDKTNDRFEISTERVGFCNLIIKCVEFVDQAEWKCVATNEFGHSTSTCFLKLQIPRHFKKPRFLECLRAVLTEEGAVNLECKVIGVPQPTLRWFKDGVELKPGDIHRIISGKDGECSLGTYTCEARNCMGIVTSSATLLGYEESYKNLPKPPEPANILQRHLSLSTIHEERTSQLYDTPMGGDITVDEKGDVSFSFDGKEVSVSLYETPDLTEEEALQIVEMYADQISEHVTEQNIVELPPLRFIKETTTSGNLLMEAIVIDVSPDYFPPDEDMRTEADMEDISVVDPISGGYEDPLSEQSSSKKRRKEESLKSIEVEEFFSLSQSRQTKQISVLENYIVEEAHSDEEITETDLQTFESAKSSQKGDSESKPKKAIKSDDSMQEVPPKLPPRKRPPVAAESSKSKDEDSVILQDISGEEGDGLKMQAKKRTDTKTTIINKSIIEKVVKHVIIVKQHLITVENEVVAQSTLMMSPASADSSIGIIKSVLEPINAIECKVNDYNGERSVESLMENLLHDLKNLNHGLSIIEKCVEMDSEGRTLVQRTSVCVIESVGEQMLTFLENLKQVCLNNVQGSLQNESLLIINDMQTGIHITEDTIKSQTLMQEASALEASQRVSESVAQMQQMPDIVPLEVVTSTELPKEANSFKLLCRYIIKFQEILESSQHSDVKKETLDEIQKPIVAIQNEIHSIEEKISKNSLKDTIEEKISFKILDTVSPPLYELNKCFEAISKSVESGNKSPKILDPFILPLQEIQNGLALIGHEIDSGFIKKDSPVDTEDNHKIIKNVAQNIIYFESNVENVRERTSITVYESLIQLKITIQSMIEKIVKEPLTKGSLQIVYALKIPLEELNYCFRHIEERSTTESLRDLLDPLNSLRENVEVAEEKLRQLRITSNADELKKIKNLVDQCDAEIQLFDIIRLDQQERINQHRLIEQQISEHSQHLSEFQQRSVITQEQCDVLTNVQQNIVNIQEIIGYDRDKSFSEHLSTLQTLANPLQELSRQIVNIREEILLENVNDISINDYKAILKLAKPLREIYQQLAIVSKQGTYESTQVFSSQSNQEILKSLATPLAELRNCIAAIQHECISMHEIQGEIEHPQISLRTARPLEELRLRVEEIIHNVMEPDEISATLDDVSVMKTISEVSEVVKTESKDEIKISETKTEEIKKEDIIQESQIQQSIEKKVESQITTSFEKQIESQIQSTVEQKIESQITTSTEQKVESSEHKVDSQIQLSTEQKVDTELDKNLSKAKEEIETLMIAINNARKPTNEVKAVESEINTILESVENLPNDIPKINKIIETIESAEKSLATKKTTDVILVKYNLESLKKTLIIIRKIIVPEVEHEKIVEAPVQQAESKANDQTPQSKIVEEKTEMKINEEKIASKIKHEKIITENIAQIDDDKSKAELKITEPSIELKIEEKPQEVLKIEESKPIDEIKIEPQTIQPTEVKDETQKLSEISEIEINLSKSKENIKDTVESIKKLKKNTPEVQALERQLSTVFENINELPNNEAQITEILNSIDSAEKSIHIKKTTDAVLVKGNLAALKQSLITLKNVITQQKAQISDVSQPQQAKIDVIETKEELKITEPSDELKIEEKTQENLKIEEKTEEVLKIEESTTESEPIDEIKIEPQTIQPPEVKSETENLTKISEVEICLSKSKENVENTVESMKKLKRITPEVQALERQLSAVFENVNDIPNNDTQINDILSSIDTAEKSIHIRKTTDAVLVKGNLEALKQSLITLRNVITQQKAQISDISSEPQQATIDVIESKEELKITESTDELKIGEKLKKLTAEEKIVNITKIEEKPCEKVEISDEKQIETPKTEENILQISEETVSKVALDETDKSLPKTKRVEDQITQSVKTEQISFAPDELQNSLTKEIENIKVAIKKAPTIPELQALEQQLTFTLENITTIANNQQALDKAFEIIEIVQSKLIAQKSTQMIEIQDNLNSLKEILIILKASAKIQQVETADLQATTQVTEIHLNEPTEQLKIEEKISTEKHEVKIVEEISTQESLKITEETQQETAAAITEHSDIIKESLIVTEIKTQSEIEICLSKTKEDIENVTISIQKARRPTAELQAAQQELNTILEKLSELPENQYKIENIIATIEKAESSIIAKKTTDIVLIKGYLQNLKQSLVILNDTVKFQKGEIKDNAQIPQVADLQIIETTDELKIIESNENIIESPKEKPQIEEKSHEILKIEEPTTESKPIDEIKIEPQTIQPSEVKDETQKLPEISEVEICLSKSKENVENTVESIKKIKRITPEVQALERQLSTVFENVNELPNNEAQIIEILNSIDFAEKSILIRKTTDAVLVKENLAALKQSLITLRNVITQQKAQISDISSEPQQATIDVIETKEELKITESSDELKIEEKSQDIPKIEEKTDEILKIEEPTTESKPIDEIKIEPQTIQPSEVKDETQKLPEISEVEICLSKSKEDIESTVESIKKIKRITPEVQALERQLSTVFENVNDIPNNDTQINEILTSIDSAEKSIHIRKTTDAVLVKENLAALKQSLITLRNVITQQKPQISDVSQPQQAKIDVIETKEELKITEPSDELKIEEKNQEVLKIEEKTDDIIKIEESKPIDEIKTEPQTIQPSEVKDETQKLSEISKVEICLSKSKENVKDTVENIKKIKRITPEVQALERQLSNLFENVNDLQNNEGQINEIINSIDSAEKSIHIRKTTDAVLVKGNLEALKQSLITLRNVITQQKAQISDISSEPQQATIDVIESKEELKITELSDKLKIEEKTDEILKFEESKPIDEIKIEPQTVQPTEIKDEIQKLSEISEFEICLSKSKENVESTVESIKKIKRITPEVQALERQLSTVFENVNELPNNEAQIIEILSSIDSAEKSIHIRKTTDAVLVKGNLAALKQSLITLKNVITQQKAQISDISSEPQQATIDVIETKEELKITESSDELKIEEKSQDIPKIEETKPTDDKIEEKSDEILKIEEKPCEKVEISEEKQIETQKTEETSEVQNILPEFEKCLSKAKEEIENVTASIKKARRPTSELQTAEKELIIILENLSNLPENQQKLEKAIESIEHAELSLATRKTSDIVVVKDNLSTLKQSLILLNNSVKSQKGDVSIIEDKAQVTDLQIIESKEELKITESNESIAEKIEDKVEVKDDLKITEPNKISVVEDKPEEIKQITDVPKDEISVEFCIKKSKTEIENAMASIKSARRPTSELQAAENELKITLDKISELQNDQKQIEKIIETIEKAEASLVTKKTSDIVLVKENLSLLKQSLVELKNSVQTQSIKVSDVTAVKQAGDLQIIEKVDDLKIIESNEDISAAADETKEEPKFIVPLELPAEIKIIEEAPIIIKCLEKSKTDIQNAVESIKKAHRPTTELQAIEKELSTTLENLSDLPKDGSKIERVIESIQSAETSLVAKKTSDMTLVKENLSTVKESLIQLKVNIKPQEIKIDEISQPKVEKALDLQIVESIEDLKIVESTEDLTITEELPKDIPITEQPLKITEEITTMTEQPTEITKSLSKSREEIENVMFAIKKARHPPDEVIVVEKSLTATYEQLFELPKDEQTLEKAIESIELAKIALVTRGAGDLMAIKENLNTLRHSLVNIIGLINLQKAEALLIELQKPQKAEILEIKEETAPNEILKIEKKSIEMPKVEANIKKLESQIEITVESIKKSRRPTPEVQAVEKEFTFAIENVQELENNKQKIEKVIELIENAETSLTAKKTSDIVLIKENLASVKETLNVLKLNAKSTTVEISEKQEIPQKAVIEDQNEKKEIVSDDKLQIVEKSDEIKQEETKAAEIKQQEIKKAEIKQSEIKTDEKLQIVEKSDEIQQPEIKSADIQQQQIILDENTNKLKAEIDSTIESIKKARRPTPEMQAVSQELTISIEQIKNLPIDSKMLEKVIQTIESAEASLVAKKTSDITVVKNNLSELKQTLNVIKGSDKIQKSEISDIKSEPLKAEKDTIEEKSSPKLELPQEIQSLKVEIESSIETIKKAHRPTTELEAAEKVLSFANENVTEFSANEVEISKAIESITAAEVSLVAKQTSDMVQVKNNLGTLRENLVVMQNKLKPQKVDVKETEISKKPVVDEIKSKIEEPSKVELPHEIKLLKSEIQNSLETIKKARHPTSELEAVEEVLSFANENVTEFSSDENKISKAIESITIAETSLLAKKTSDIVLVKSNLGELKEKLVVIQNKLKPQQAAVKMTEEIEVKAPVDEIKPRDDTKIEKSAEEIAKPIIEEPAPIIEKKLTPELLKLKSDINDTIESIKKSRRPTSEMQAIEKELNTVVENVENLPSDQTNLLKLIDSIETTEASLQLKKTSDIVIVKDNLKLLKESLNVYKTSPPPPTEIKEQPKKIDDTPKVEEIIQPKVIESEVVIKLRKEFESTSATIKKVRRPTPELQNVDAELTIVLKKLPEFENDVPHIQKTITIISSAEDSLITKRTSDAIAAKDSLSILKKSLTNLKDSKKIVEVIEENIKKTEATVESKVDEKPTEPKLEVKDEIKPEETKVIIKLDNTAKKLKLEIENVLESIKKARRLTPEVESFEKTLSATLDLKILVDVPTDLSKLDELLKSIDIAENSIITRKTSDMVLVKNNLISLKDYVNVLKNKLLPSPSKKEDEIIVDKANEKVSEEPSKEKEQISEVSLVFEEKDLMAQYIIAIKEELDDVIMNIKKTRRPSTELQTLHETLIDLKPKVDNLNSDLTYFDNVISVVSKAKAYLLTKRTMELILLREKVTSLENSLNLLKSTVVTEINGEIIAAQQEKDNEKSKEEARAEQTRKEQEESLKKQIEEETLKKKKMEEEEALNKKKLEEEALEKKKLEEEALEKKKLEEEALKKKKLEEEALKKKKLEDEALKKKKEEEEVLKKKKLEEEALKKKKEEEEALKKKKLEEEALKKKKLEDEALKKKKEEEEVLKKKKLEEEALKKKKEEEEALKKKKEEEEALKKMKLEEEALKKKKLEDEALKKKKLEEESLKKKKEEEESLKKKKEEEEALKQKKLEEEASKKKKLEEEALKKKKLEEEALKKQKEEAEALKQEKLRKEQEEEKSRKEDERKRREEELRKREDLENERLEQERKRRDEDRKKRQEEDDKREKEELERQEERKRRKEEMRKQQEEQERIFEEERKRREEERKKRQEQIEIEPEKPIRRRRANDDTENYDVRKSSYTIDETPVPAERKRHRQPQETNNQLETEPIKPTRKRRTDELKDDDQSLPRTPDTRRKRMPTFIARLKNRSAAENSILKLTCAISEPDCLVNWTKDGMILKNSEKYFIENNNGILSLEIKNACAQDAGEYCCFVSNVCGEIETSAFVTIFGEEVQQASTLFTKHLKGESIFLSLLIFIGFM